MDDDTNLTQDSFAEMLSGPPDNGQPEPEQASEDDPQNGEPEQETAEETAPEEAEAEVEAEAEPEPEEQPEKESTEAFLELEINGEKVKVSKDEAKNGYLRQQDYTQKAQRLSQERQEMQAHIQQQFEQVQQFSQEIGQLNGLDAQIAQYRTVDWEALELADSLSYSTHLAKFNDLRARRGVMAQAVGQRQQALTREAQQAQHQAFVQQTQEAQAYLAQKIPGFGKETLSQMKEFGTKHGFSPAELANVADKRMLEVLWKASEYDKANDKAKASEATTKAAVQQAIKKVSALPTKASKPAPAAKAALDTTLDKHRQRVRQGGKARDFAALLDAAS